jgi:hypothetical protein
MRLSCSSPMRYVHSFVRSACVRLHLPDSLG